MENAYLETSSINQALEDGLSGSQINDVAQSAGYRISVGMHTIYELARTFLNPEQHEKGVQLFTILRDVECSYVPMTSQLIQSEIVKLRSGPAVMPFLDHKNQVAARYEIESMAQGFTDRATKFIWGRENDRRQKEPVENFEYVERLKKLGAAKPQMDFDQFYNAACADLLEIISAVVKIPISHHEAESLSRRIDEFPCLKAVVRANVYLTYIMSRNRVAPSYDRVDDFRQVADASYCHIFVSNDRQLLRTANRISPQLKFVAWAAFCAGGV